MHWFTSGTQLCVPNAKASSCAIHFSLHLGSRYKSDARCLLWDKPGEHVFFRRALEAKHKLHGRLPTKMPVHATSLPCNQENTHIQYQTSFCSPKKNFKRSPTYLVFVRILVGAFLVHPGVTVSALTSECTILNGIFRNMSGLFPMRFSNQVSASSVG